MRFLAALMLTLCFSSAQAVLNTDSLPSGSAAN